MIYECIKSFYMDLVDDNGFPEKEDGFCVEEGTIWEKEDVLATLTGADIRLTRRLESSGGSEWLEISREKLNEHFKQFVD